MKFITSRILSPTETKSLQDIAQDIINKRQEETKSVEKTASANKQTKTSSSKPVEAVKEKTSKPKVEAKPETVKAKVETKTVKTKTDNKSESVKSKTESKNKVSKDKTSKEANSEEVKSLKIKDVKSSKKQARRLPRVVLRKVAKLTDKDKGYLKKYFERYYSSDYVDALLSQY